MEKDKVLTSQDYIDMESKWGAHNYHPLDCVLTKGDGCYVWDIEGHKYLDCLSGYSAVNQGHCHPRILKACISQASRLTLTARAFRNDQLPLLCKEVCELLKFDKMLPMNSGAEAVETAIKIQPDMVTIAKALSGGFYPVSMMLCNDNIMDVIVPLDHGSTFGGNPLACAIAREALKVIVEEKLCENSEQLGNWMLTELQSIKSPHIECVRGKGLWIGIVLKESAKGARRFCEELKKRGILCKETHYNIIRVAPPLIVKKEQLEFVVKTMKDVLSMP